MNGDDYVVRVEGLAKRYGTVHALDGLSFSILRGETFVILGPNGAGKTTLVEIIEGILRQDEGIVEVFGMNPGRLEVRRRIGVQTEAGTFENELQVREILRMYAAFYGKRGQPDELLRRLDLNGKARAPYKTLSKGMKQKVALAVALVNSPDLLFLDEMTSGLDVEARRQVWDHIIDLKSGGTTIVMTTHDMQEAAALGDRVLLIDKGKTKRIAPIRELLDEFPARSKVEYIGESWVSGGVVASWSSGSRHVLFTDNAGEIRLAVERAGGRVLQVGEVTLEDIYLHELNKEAVS